MTVALESVPRIEYKLAEVEVSKMKIDPRYQRDYHGEKAINKTAAAYDPLLVEPLVLSFRDGWYFVVCGQNRFLTARKLGIKTLPAIVYYGLSSEDDSRIFRLTDSQTVRLTLRDKHKASVHEKIPLALEVDRIIHAHGHIGFSSKAVGSLRAAGTAYALAEAEVLDQTLSVTDTWRREDDTWMPSANDSQVLRSIGEFFRRHPAVSINEVAKVCARHNPVELRVAGFGGRSASDGWRIVQGWYNRGRTTNRLPA